MGNTFISGFNPLCDENGQGLQERFAKQIGLIGEVTTDVYCIFISDDNKCRKYKINDNIISLAVHLFVCEFLILV